MNDPHDHRMFVVLHDGRYVAHARGFGAAIDVAESLGSLKGGDWRPMRLLLPRTPADLALSARYAPTCATVRTADCYGVFDGIDGFALMELR